MAQAGKTFRIFVSSTFSDLKAERDVLQREVFPRLRELCLRHGCRFQAIDLRWGVSEEASLDQQTMKICLEELRRCQKVTPRPNFIVLLGDRYGWRPLPCEIPAAEFEKILARLPGEGVERSRQEKLLKTWYWRDDNAAPPVYVLQPRTGKYRQRHCWEPVQQELRDLLAAAIREMDLSPEARRKYLTAATEQEIVQGLSLPDCSEHVFCFFRSIANLPAEESAADFIDLDAKGRLDEPAQRCLDRLRDDLASGLPGNLHFYEAHWQGEGSITTGHLGSLPESLEDCLKLNEGADAPATLCVDVWRRLSRLILVEIAKLEQIDPLEQESAAHAAFGRERAGKFVGRAEILGVIQDYLQGDVPHPLAVWGESGAGKSALLAQAALEAQKAHPQAVVAQRFIGATPPSSDIRLLLESLCREISRAYGVKDDDLPVEFRKLEEEFPRRLALAKPDKPLILILDALDQLSDAEQARRLYWLPETLPSQVRFVVSTLPEEPDRQSDPSPFSAEGLAVLKKKLPETQLVALDPMTLEEGGGLLDTWLREAGRTLRPHQRQEVLGKFADNGLPLYLRLAFEGARQWRSYDAPDQARLSQDIPGIIRDLFRRLSQPAHHGAVLVSRSLGYLAAGKNGLTEDELLEVLSTEADQAVMDDFRKRSPKSPPVDRLPVAVWSRLHFDLAPFLTERQADGAALLAFYHRQLKEVVEEDYLSGSEKTERHAALARYFDEQPLYLVEDQWDSRNVRKVSELPFQQTHGELWDDLDRKTLCDFRFLEAKCAGGMTYNLINDYQAALAALPEAYEKMLRKKKYAGRVRHYTKKMITYAEAWNQARKRHTQNPEKHPLPRPEDIPLPKAISSVKPWSDRRIRKERKRIIQNPTRLNRLKAFSQFANFNSQGLVKFGDLPGFCRQQAYNFARSGPVASVAEVLVETVKDDILLLLTPSGRQEFNICPAVQKILPQSRSSLESEDPDVSITPDGSRAAAIRGFFLRVWDLESGELLKALKTPESDKIMSVSLTPNGKVIVTGDKNANLRVWDWERGTCIRTMRGHRSGIQCISLTPDGKRAVSGSIDTTLRVWDLENGTCIRKLEGHEKGIMAVSLTPDGNLAISGGSDLRVWDLERGRCLWVLPGHTGWIHSVALTPDGKTAVTAGTDKTLRVWDVKRGECLHVLIGHTDKVHGVSLTADGKMAISTSADTTIKFWDLKSGVCVRTITDWLGKFDIKVTPDGKIAVTICEDYSLRVWDLEMGQSPRKPKDYLGWIFKVDIDSKYAYSIGEDMTERTWDLKRSQCLYAASRYEYPIPTKPHTPDLTRFVSKKGGEPLYPGILDVGYNSISDPPFFYPSAHNARGPNRSLEVWDCLKNECLHHLEAQSDITDVHFSPDGKLAISVSHELQLWDLGQGTCLRSLDPGILYLIRKMSLSPDGRIAVSGTYGQLYIWDLRSGKCRHKLYGHGDWITGISITPDGNLAISASSDRTIRVWDLKSGACQAVYQAGSIISTLSNIHPSGFFIYGTAGEIVSLNLCNAPIDLPWTTPVRCWDGGWEKKIGSVCPWCKRWFAVAAKILQAIRDINRSANLTPDQSPCLELPDEAWEEPQLLSECPKCRKPLKFNPFIVDNRYRY